MTIMPGYKADGTSAEAAAAISDRAVILRAQVRGELLKSPAGLTADEIAARLSESVLAIRPRVSELHRDGALKKSGRRRKNISGCSANVWVLV